MLRALTFSVLAAVAATLTAPLAFASADVSVVKAMTSMPPTVSSAQAVAWLNQQRQANGIPR